MNRADYALLGIGIMATLMVFVPIVASAEIQFAFAQVTNSTFTNSIYQLYTNYYKLYIYQLYFYYNYIFRAYS